MKAISLWQPWATLWVVQAKRNETRSWATGYKGPLAVHAAKRWTEAEVRLAMMQEPFRTTLRDLGYEYFSLLPRGAIIGVCDGVVCRPVQDALAEIAPERRFLETAFGDFTRGRFAWLPTNMRALKTPIPCRGFQQLWDVPADVLEAIDSQQLQSKLPEAAT